MFNIVFKTKLTCSFIFTRTKQFFCFLLLILSLFLYPETHTIWGWLIELDASSNVAARLAFKVCVSLDIIANQQRLQKNLVPVQVWFIMFEELTKAWRHIVDLDKPQYRKALKKRDEVTGKLLREGDTFCLFIMTHFGAKASKNSSKGTLESAWGSRSKISVPRLKWVLYGHKPLICELETAAPKPPIRKCLLLQMGLRCDFEEKQPLVQLDFMDIIIMYGGGRERLGCFIKQMALSTMWLNPISKH